MVARLVAGLLIALATQQTGREPAKKYANVEPWLFRAIGDPDFDRLLEPSLRVLTPDVRAEVERRLARRAAYRAQLGPISPGLEFPANVDARNRMSIRTAIVVLLETRDTSTDTRAAIEREAAAFARGATLYYEWEGYADGPFNEAASADVYRQTHPSTLLRPYLDLFLLHRYRCAFEAATWEIGQYPWPQPTVEKREASDNANRDYQKRAAAKYVEVWQRLNSTTDPVVRAIADELDGVRLAYIAVSVHPRTFVPR